MIKILIISILISLLIVLDKNIYSNFKCGTDQNNDITYRGVGILKNQGFKPHQTVYIHYENGDLDQINQANSILKQYAFPFINLNFKIGNLDEYKNMKDNIIKIHLKPNETPTAKISGYTTNTGTTKPIIKMFQLKKAHLLHEFGHAMGMYREQQNPSPTNKISFNVPKFTDYAINTRHLKPAGVKAQYLTKRDPKKSLYTTWDINSIMEYQIKDDLLNAPLNIPINTEYSTGDKNWFKLKYGVKK